MPPRSYRLFAHDWRRGDPVAWFNAMEEREIDTILTPAQGASVLLRDDLAGSEFLFTEPDEIVIVERLEEVIPSLRRLDGLRRSGKWLAGYVAYEAGFAFEPKLAAVMPEGRRTPLLQIGVFTRPRQRKVRQWKSSDARLHDAHATWGFEHYCVRFERLHRHLRSGDCYQGNLTFPVTARWGGAPNDIFDAMTARQPVRYGALVQLGGPVVLSRSPELFFEIGRNGFIETHPMKGTIRRGATPREDAELADTLRNDPKNQAENRMIVDLLRNDLSRISEVGSVQVPELFRIETYPTVHQMVSRVRAILTPGTGLTEIFAALFPCGSITGAPKLSAMLILNELEGQPRDAYCGAIGWAAPGGEMRFSVAIRTVTLHEKGEAIFNVGGGIVFDSDARSEYDECLLKARFATDSALTID